MTVIVKDVEMRIAGVASTVGGGGCVCAARGNRLRVHVALCCRASSAEMSLQAWHAALGAAGLVCSTLACRASARAGNRLLGGTAQQTRLSLRGASLAGKCVERT